MIIGPGKYTKDKSIRPDGIMLTMPNMFFEDRGWSVDQFKMYFKKFMAGEDNTWNYRLTNLPTLDFAWVYLVFDKQVQFRLNLVMIERNVTKVFNDGPDHKTRTFPNANWIILSGPAIEPPYEWPQKGFQGFRYTTKLF